MEVFWKSQGTTNRSPTSFGNILCIFISLESFQNLVRFSGRCSKMLRNFQDKMQAKEKETNTYKTIGHKKTKCRDSCSITPKNYKQINFIKKHKKNSPLLI